MKKLLLPEIIFPRGFNNTKQYTAYLAEVKNLLEKFNIVDAVIVFTGSSTTGYSKNPAKVGKFFGKDSDIDASFDSPELIDFLEKQGIVGSKKIPGLFLPKHFKKCSEKSELWDALEELDQKWFKILGRDIEMAIKRRKTCLTDIVVYF